MYSPNIPARCIISFPSAPEIGTGTIYSDRRRLKTWTASSTSSCIWQPKGRASQTDSGDPWRWSLGWHSSPVADCIWLSLQGTNKTIAMHYHHMMIWIDMIYCIHFVYQIAMQILCKMAYLAYLNNWDVNSDVIYPNDLDSQSRSPEIAIWVSQRCPALAATFVL